MQKIQFSFRPFIIAGLMLAASAGLASARLLGDPVPDTKAGSLAGGLGITSISRSFKSEADVDVVYVCGFSLCTKKKTVSDTGSDSWNHMTVFGEYGFSDRSALRIEVGTVNSAGDSGTEFGAVYRQAVGAARTLKTKPFQLGLIAGVHSGGIDAGGATFSYTEIEVGFGGSVAISQELKAYAAALYDQMTGSVDGSNAKITSANPIGIYGGVSYAVDKDILVGGEYHLMFENGVAVYGKMMF